MTADISSYSADNLDNIDMVFIENYPEEELDELKEKAMERAERCDYDTTLIDIKNAFRENITVSLVYNYNKEENFESCDLNVNCEPRVGDIFIWQFAMSDEKRLTACISCAKDFVLKNSVSAITEEVN